MLAKKTNPSTAVDKERDMGIIKKIRPVLTLGEGAYAEIQGRDEFR